MQFLIFIVFPTSVNGNSILSLTEAKNHRLISNFSLCHTLASNPPANHIHSAFKGYPETEWTESIYRRSTLPQTTVNFGLNVKDSQLLEGRRERTKAGRFWRRVTQKKGRACNKFSTFSFFTTLTLRAALIYILKNNENSQEGLQACFL